eukprot:CAMPEP_0182579650 /NCGR_PEP_ID=MMETSP1324-20130603/44670_1 /TAXON_ID=236786 /ORGANISM="Florenciella sp., Strain RCC1587" /LENGTH=263 /DNA_ID=CAMNT_0024795773 /DNA_START=48 /DNA_END=836 /DNA_ORIENTATION=-
MSGICFGLISALRRFYHGPYDDNVDFVYIIIACVTCAFLILVCARFKPVTRTIEWIRLSERQREDQEQIPKYGPLQGNVQEPFLSPGLACPLEQRMTKFSKMLGGSKSWLSFDRVQMERVPFAYGGSGHVFMGSLGCEKGTARSKRVPCAIKCLHAQLMTPMDTQEFMHECSMLSQLNNHPNLVEFYGFSVHEQVTYIVTEFVPLRLMDTLCRKPKDDTTLFYRVTQQILTTVAFIHDQSVVHRDLKPSNVLLTADLQVKVCD